FIPYTALDGQIGQMIGRWTDDTYFLCHSYGVRAVMQMIAAWTAGPRVPLVLSFDPSQWVWPGANDVPARVEFCHNFYQRGWPIGNQRLKRIGGGEAGIVNEEVSSSHTGIDDLLYTQTKAFGYLKSQLKLED